MLIDYKNVEIRRGERTLLTGINFHADAGEFIYIIGKVGSGKSSLLKSFYGEQPIQTGEAFVLDQDVTRLRSRKVPALRRRLGIIFQDFQLLRDRTVRQNLDFVLKATGWKRADREARILEVLEKVGLTEKLDLFPHELSGGEQQRVAIARALLNDPEIILADEPTGNLDDETSRHIVEILRDVRERGTAIIMVTHNRNILSAYPGIVYRCEEHTMREVTDEYNQPINLL